jgi:hypothetical protein
MNLAILVSQIGGQFHNMTQYDAVPLVVLKNPILDRVQPLCLYL